MREEQEQYRCPETRVVALVSKMRVLNASKTGTIERQQYDEEL